MKKTIVLVGLLMGVMSLGATELSDRIAAFGRLTAKVSGGERTATFLHAGGKAEQPWLKGVPECAVVEFTLRPTPESEIHCRLFLPPPAKWNGRFWGIGNTALGDSLDPLHVEALHLPRLREGAATCEADMGTTNGRFGREVVRDFGWRSHHLMCVEAKRMIAEFYGRPAKKNYFYGVSSGGGQGLHEAQRFPEDYDGIVCYVPAHYRTRLAELGRADYREGKRRDRKGFMNRVLNGPKAKNEYDMDDAEFAAFLDEIRSDVDASSTDLDAFVKRGGKLMIVSGLVDKIVPTETARDYCEALARRYGGADKVTPFFRAYFLPGRGHTKAETADGVEDIPSAAAMIEWVEKGEVPGPQRGQRKNGGSLTVAPWDGTGSGGACAPANIVCEAKAYNSWPMIQAVGGRLCCAYSRGSAHTIDEGQRGVWAKVSENGGATWSEEVLIANDPRWGEVTIGKGSDATGAMLLWVRCWGERAHHDLYRSADGIRFEKIATPAIDPLPMQITDIIRVPDVGLMCLWFSAAYRDGQDKAWGTLVSQDEGCTWTQRTVESGLKREDWPTEPSGVWLGNGRILVIARSEGNTKYQFQLVSSDSGKSWRKSRTNIIDVQESTPSLVYDDKTGTVYNYYYQRGARQLKCRRTKADFIFGHPMEWPEPEVLFEGREQRAYDAGNVNVTVLNGRHYAATYTGSTTDTAVLVVSVR